MTVFICPDDIKKKKKRNTHTLMVYMFMTINDKLSLL